MKQLPLLLVFFCIGMQAAAQNGTGNYRVIKSLADMKKTIVAVQADAPLFVQNFSDHSQEHDVNTIILDIENYINTAKTNTGSDIILNKQFAALRHFFLTTTNKTAVATSFLYTSQPYRFCNYNDSTALYTYAIKDGDTYNLGKVTEKRALKLVLENCLLPSLKALDEFKSNEVPYIGLSVYFGCTDNREGSSKSTVLPYCLTIVAHLADIQLYNTGVITAKGLLSVADLYVSDTDNAATLSKVTVLID